MLGKLDCIEKKQDKYDSFTRSRNRFQYAQEVKVVPWGTPISGYGTYAPLDWIQFLPPPPDPIDCLPSHYSRSQ